MDAKPRIRRLWLDEEAATAVEYAVLLGLIIAFAIVAISSLGGGVQARWEQNANQIIEASETAAGS
jgi:Flp pilus assembly pilin Flp